MSMISFNNIKNAPGFRTIKATAAHQLDNCRKIINNECITVEEKVMEIIKEYGNFYIDRFEHYSGDKLRF